jgi:hypothetical protein
MVKSFPVSYLIATVLLRELTHVRIRIGCMQPIRSSGFSSFGSQLAIATSKQWSTLLSYTTPIDFAAVSDQQVSFIRKSLDMWLACVVGDHFDVVQWTVCVS